MTIERGQRHNPGQSAFKTILPEEIEWTAFAAFPPSVELAVVVGHPSEPGPYVIRVKVPAGAKLMPHKHPEDRVYTVISGVFYIGLGDAFDASVLEAVPPGAVVVLPGGTSHFHWARSGEYVTQVTGIGPLGLEYVVPSDDPRLLSARDASLRVVSASTTSIVAGLDPWPAGAAPRSDRLRAARARPGARSVGRAQCVSTRRAGINVRSQRA